MALGLDYLSDFFCGYYMEVPLYVCKRISLDYNFFMVIFIIEVEDVVENWI